MFALLTRAGLKFKGAFYHYAARMISTEDIPDKFDITGLFPIWKRKGSALDLSMMRYIHSKEWDTRLIDALITEHMNTFFILAGNQEMAATSSL